MSITCWQEHFPICLFIFQDLYLCNPTLTSMKKVQWKPVWGLLAEIRIYRNCLIGGQWWNLMTPLWSRINGNIHYPIKENYSRSSISQQDKGWMHKWMDGYHHGLSVCDFHIFGALIQFGSWNAAGCSWLILPANFKNVIQCLVTWWNVSHCSLIGRWENWVQTRMNKK
jgi:hypothetical protein